MYAKYLSLSFTHVRLWQRSLLWADLNNSNISFVLMTDVAECVDKLALSVPFLLLFTILEN